MKTMCIFLLLTAAAFAQDPIAAIRKFNDPQQRGAVLERDADLPDLTHFAAVESSPLLFEAKTIRLITPDVAVVNAAANQYGSLTFKRSWAALFVLHRESGQWKIAILRIVWEK